MGNKLVVFISGWSGRKFLWAPLSHRFQSVGYDVITANVPNHGFGDILDASCHIAIMLQEVRQFYDKIVILGHSMGGLIGRAVIQHLGSDVDAYVSLGTPHRGTEVARLAPWSDSAKQMTPGSAFLESLEEEPWPGVPALALQAQFEEIVLPQRNAAIDFGRNVTIPYTGHVTLTLSQRAFLEIWEWLTNEVFFETGAFVTPGVSSELSI